MLRPEPGAFLGLAGMLETSDRMTSTGARECVARYPAATSELLSRESGAALVRVPGQTPENQTYTQHIGDMVDKVVVALRGKK